MERKKSSTRIIFGWSFFFSFSFLFSFFRSASSFCREKIFTLIHIDCLLYANIYINDTPRTLWNNFGNGYATDWISKFTFVAGKSMTYTIRKQERNREMCVCVYLSAAGEHCYSLFPPRSHWILQFYAHFKCAPYHSPSLWHQAKHTHTHCKATALREREKNRARRAERKKPNRRSVYIRNVRFWRDEWKNIEIKGSFGMCGPSVFNILFLCTIKFWNCNGLFNDWNRNGSTFLFFHQRRHRRRRSRFPFRHLRAHLVKFPWQWTRL